MPKEELSAGKLLRDELDLRAAVKALQFPEGLYMFTVRSASPAAADHGHGLVFPALHVAPGPGCPHNAVVFVGSPKSSGVWLYKPGDKLVVRVDMPNASLVVSSVRANGAQPLDVKVERLDGLNTSDGVGKTAGSLPDSFNDSKEAVKLQIGLHLRNYGDNTFNGSQWAGLVAERAWIEALSVSVLDTLASADVEYKGLSANGIETPWISDGALCGTTGKGLPLIGFAARMKAAAAVTYDCEYSAHFMSGATVGPVRNGVPCRSQTAMDPLLAIQFRIVKRAAPALPGKPEKLRSQSVGAGPRFSKLREAVASVAAKAGGKSSSKKVPARKK